MAKQYSYLNGVDFNTTAATALIVPSGTTIIASGTNKIVSTFAGAADSYGIYAKGGILTFDSESSGSLIVKSGNVSGSQKESAGIINENGEIVFNGGNIAGEAGTSANSLSIGICSRKINAGSGDITVSGGNVTATGSSGMYSYGMIAVGKLTVSGGTLNATGGAAINQSEGIYANEMEVSAGSVTATGGATTGTNGYSGGIVTSKNIEDGNNFIVSGGTVNATGGKCTGASFSEEYGSESNGICTLYTLGSTINGGGISITGGTVTAAGGVVTDPKAYTIGVLTKLFTISGNGAMTASGDNAAAYSGGVISYGDININNTGLTAKGNKVALYSGDEDNKDNNRAVIFGTGVTAKASTNYDGTNYANHKTADIDKYKWVKSSAKTVEAPGFSLAEGAYTGSQKVKLSCSFPEDAAIEYSINDGNYQSYTKGSDITIDKNMNIKARASKADWGPVEAEISEANYTINLPIKISPSKSFVKGSCGGDYTAIIGEGMNIDPESLNKVSMDGQELEEGEAYTTDL